MPARLTLMCALLLSWGALSAGPYADAAEQVSFELDVQPILTARGCNAGACHGKQRGQNGFQLSLLGFDSDFDFAALATNRCSASPDLRLAAARRCTIALG
jgi:hypothetical protein